MSGSAWDYQRRQQYHFQPGQQLHQGAGSGLPVARNGRTFWSQAALYGCQ